MKVFLMMIIINTLGVYSLVSYACAPCSCQLNGWDRDGFGICGGHSAGRPSGFLGTQCEYPPCDSNCKCM